MKNTLQVKVEQLKKANAAKDEKIAQLQAELSAAKTRLEEVKQKAQADLADCARGGRERIEEYRTSIQALFTARDRMAALLASR